MRVPPGRFGACRSKPWLTTLLELPVTLLDVVGVRREGAEEKLVAAVLPVNAVDVSERLDAKNPSPKVF